ncbi:MAG: transketolase [bacterium]
MTIKYSIPKAEVELKSLKKEIIRLSMQKKEGHIGSSLSILHILYHLYATVFDRNITKDSNKFILSKGHAALGLYVILHHFSYISREELDSFCGFESILGGHPNVRKISAVSASTGSLGHGLPMATGIAMAKKIQENLGKVYCLIGDGEANEGTIWEAALLASEHSLGNLTCIMDMNMSGERAIRLGNLLSKFQSFGFESYEIDGHDLHAISEALEIQLDSSKPKFILANTVKGKGIRRMEGNPAWHHRSPTESEYEEIIQEFSEEL